MAYTPLTREQYQKAINSGFSPDAITQMEKKRKMEEESKTMTQPVQTVQPEEKFGGPKWLGSKQMSAQEFTDQPMIKQITQAFFTTLPKDFTDFFKIAAKAPAELAISAGEVPTDIYAFATGKPKIQTEYNVPLLGKMQSIQTKAQKTLQSGETTPKSAIGTPLGEGATPEMKEIMTPNRPFGWHGFVAPVIQAGLDGLITASELQSVVNVSAKLFGDAPLNDLSKATPGLIKKGIDKLEAKLGGKTISPKEVEWGKQFVMPKATTKVKETALQQGRVTEQGLLKGSKITPSARDERTYEAVKDIISKDKSTTQNLDAIRNKISEINTGVKAYIQKNKVPRNTAQLKAFLNKGREDLRLIFASDKQAAKLYDEIVNEYMRNVGSKDTLGFFEARQNFDKVPAIKKLLDSQGLGENAKKEIVLTVRDMANKYIAKLLPEGNEYRALLLKESNMINAIKNIAASNAKFIGKSKLIQLVNEYPILKWIVGGLVGGASVGVGGSILSSTD